MPETGARIEHARKLRLEVRDVQEVYGASNPTGMIPDSDLLKALAQKLFACRYKDMTTGHFMNIRELLLLHVDMGGAITEWNAAFLVAKLETIDLYCCPGASEAIQALAQTQDVMLKTLVFADTKLTNDSILADLEHLLPGCYHLRDLSINVQGVSRMVNFAHLALPKLKTLVVHIFDSSEKPAELQWSYDEYISLFIRFPFLKAMSCTFPQVDLLSDHPMVWSRFVDALRFAKSLCSIRISPWPTVTSAKSMKHDYYTSLLQVIATEIINVREKGTGLQSIMFGCGQIDRFHEIKAVQIFGQAHVHGPRGKYALQALPISNVDYELVVAELVVALSGQRRDREGR
ncbi:Hypothetical protein D9617_4g003130 [Elsinoe fawcettii]|nr:Hypothetical protein D9617_4g003130 [Elsinoe fawcettii]